MLRRDLGVTGGSFALVMGAGLLSYSLSGLVHGPDQADGPGAVSPRPTVTVTASATPAAAPTSSASSPGASPGFPAEPVSARSSAGTAPAPVTSRPVPHPTVRPTPTPSPSPSKSCPAALLVVLPLTSRPCPLLQIGGS